MDRNKTIIKTSVIGIGVNLVLVAFKMLVGVVAGSISVILDGVNNLGDALSSIITIIGTKLANRSPDKKHPFGHGRIEYITSVVIAVIILIAGITSMRESIEKLIEPTKANYTVMSLAVIAVAVAAKLVCGRYVKSVGKQISAQALVASGTDAFFDAILSLGTLAAAIVSMLWDVSIEGMIGVVISVFILRSGVEILIDTLNSIIGVRADSGLTAAIKEKVCSVEGVLGTYDLTLHNYGPTKIIGSVHIEVCGDMTASQIHKLTRKITVEIYEDFGVILTVGIYANNTDSKVLSDVRADLEELAAQCPDVLQIHGFYSEPETNTISFDLVVDFDADGEAIRDMIYSRIKEKYPQYEFYILLDADYSD